MTNPIFRETTPSTIGAAIADKHQSTSSDSTGGSELSSGIKPKHVNLQRLRNGGRPASDTFVPSDKLARAVRLKAFSKAYFQHERQNLAQILWSRSRKQRKVIIDNFYQVKQKQFSLFLRTQASNELDGGSAQKAPQPESQNYLSSGLTFERTLPPKTTKPDENQFISYLSANGKKSIEEIRADIDQAVSKRHISMACCEGFLGRDHSPEIKRVYEIFEKLVLGYNALASNYAGRQFRGRMFVVDSAEANAFVFAEHDDVYITTGLLRECARYCERHNIPFSEEIIAAVLAHELCHILQDSAYEGLSFSELLQDNTHHANMMALKRNAETDADLTALSILQKAGYSPSQMPVLLEFLKHITTSATAAQAFSTHPHPKQRISAIETHLGNPNVVTQTWNTPLNILPAKDWARIGSHNHAAPLAVQELRLDALVKSLDNVSSAKKVVEIALLIDERAEQARVKALANKPEVKSQFAQSVFANNIILIAEQMLTAAGELNTSSEQKKGANYGFFLAEQVDENEFLQHPEVLNISAEALKVIVEQARLNSNKIFTSELSRIIENIGKANLSDSVKKQLLTQLGELITFYSNNLDKAASLMEPGADCSIEAKDLAKKLLNGDKSDAKLLLKVPYSVFNRFGAQSLDVTVQAPDVIAGLTDGLQACAEIETSSLYRQHSAYTKLENAEQREKAYCAVRYEWTEKYRKQNTSDTSSTFRVTQLESIRKAMLRSLLALKASSAPGSAYVYIDNRRISLIANEFDRLISGFKRPDSKTPLLSQDDYRATLLFLKEKGILPLPSALRSSIYADENGLCPLGKYEIPGPSQSHSQSTLLEIQGDASTAAELLKNRLETHRPQSLNPDEYDSTFEERRELPNWVRRQIQEDLQVYSRPFREEVLKQLLEHGSAFHLLAYELGLRKTFEICRQEVGSAGAFSIVEAIMLKMQPPVLRTRAEQVKEQSEFLDWYLGKVKEEKRILPSQFGWFYLKTKLIALEQSGTPINKETALPIIERLSHVCILKAQIGAACYVIDHTSFAGNEDQKEEALIGRMLKSSCGRSLNADEIPIAFFTIPGADCYHRDSSDSYSRDMESARREQTFFRAIFDLSLEQLGVISNNQRRLLSSASNSLSKQTGRIDSSPYESNSLFFAILNGLMIQRALEHISSSSNPISSENFFSVLNAKFAPKGELIEYRLGNSNRSFSDWARTARETCNDDEKLGALFELLSENFIRFMGISGSVYNNTDTFFEELLNRTQQATLFPKFAALLIDVQLPSKRQAEAKQVNTSRVSYLQELASRVSIEGFKAKAFSRYIHKHSEEFNNSDKESVTANIELLKRYFKLPCLYLDGLIDFLERKVCPEIHKWSQVDLSNFPPETSEVAAATFQNSLIEIPLEWQNLRSLKPQSWSESERLAALDYYELSIPMLFDPQRKVRFGCTALKVWQAQNHHPSFGEELSAITRYLPDASAIRDTEIDALVGRHKIGGNGVGVAAIRAAQNLYTSFQGLQYEKEMTSANGVAQVLRSFSSVAARSDRRDFLLWIIDKKKYPLPKALANIENVRNVDFALLPDHARWAPPVFQHDMLRSLLLGENGLLNCRNQGDVTIRNDLANSLFDHFFPASAGNNRDSGVSSENLAVLRDVFSWILQEYSPGRAARIIETLVDLEFSDPQGGLSQLSFGSRLTTLLGCLGPVGAKIGQILADKEDLVPSASLRNELAQLKTAAPPVSSIGVTDSVLAAGYSLDNVEIGDYLNSASMKQVHAGRIKTQNGWQEAVIKALRPDLTRGLPEDFRVFRIIANRLKAEKNIDLGGMPDTVETVINQEKDLSCEVQNGKDIDENTELAKEGVLVARPFVSPNEARNGVMIEEKVRGLPMKKFFELKSQKKEALLTALKKAGLSDDECKETAKVKPEAQRGKLRRVFLQQVLENGIFHGDLHDGNAMLSAKGTYLIDLGLVGRLTPAQKQSVIKILKGILLRNAKEIANGIQDFLDMPTANPNTQDKLLIDAKAALKNLSLESLLSQLGAIVLRSPASPDSKAALSTLIKGGCNAEWLFPLDALRAMNTFNDVASRLHLSGPEKRRALLVNIPVVMEETLRLAAQSGKKALFNPIMNKLASYWKILRIKTTQAILFYKTRKSASETLESAAEVALNMFGDASKTRPSSIQKMSSVKKTQIAQWAQNGISGYTFSVDEEALKTYTKNNPEVTVEMLKRYIQLEIGFLMLTRRERNNPYHIARLGLMSTKEEQRTYSSISPIEPVASTDEIDHLVANNLAARRMQIEFPKVNVDFLHIIAPQLRWIIDQQTDLYLRLGDIQKQVELIKQKDGQKRAVPLSPREILSSGNVSAPNGDMTYSATIWALEKLGPKTTAVTRECDYETPNLPAFIYSKEILNRLKGFRLAVNELAFSSVNLGETEHDICFSAVRHGHNEGGRIAVELHDIESGQSVHLELNDKTYKDFLEGRRVEKGSVYKYYL